MRLDEFQFVLIDKQTKNELALSFNDLYGYLDPMGDNSGILVRYNEDHPKGKEHYIPKFWKGMLVSHNCTRKSGACNKELLVKYAPDYSYCDYPELELKDFRFKLTNMRREESVVISFEDLIAHETGRWTIEPQGIFIEKKEGIPESLAGTIFVNNNGYFFDGFNPMLEIEYISPEKNDNMQWKRWNGKDGMEDNYDHSRILRSRKNNVLSAKSSCD